jgi:hypothetical protein
LKKVAARAEEKNKRDTDALTFNINDLSDNEEQVKKPAPKTSLLDASGRKANGVRTKQPSSLSSRRAASALSIHSDTSSNSKGPTVVRTTDTRRPLSSLYQGRKPAARNIIPVKRSHAESATGEAASRTTIGYNRGRSASSLVSTRRRGTDAREVTQRQVKPSGTVSPAQSDLTITPSRLGQAVQKDQETKLQPQFMSIFDEDGDDDDLPPLSQPLHISDDEDEDFVLKLDF